MLQHNELCNFNFFIIGTSQVFAHSYVKGAIINYSENKFKSKQTVFLELPSESTANRDF